MRKRTWILLGALSLLVSCSSPQINIQAEIDKANHCKIVADCKDLGSHCPFGCNVLVNKLETNNVQKLIEQYNQSTSQKCAYDCLSIKKIKCIGSKCTAIYQQ